MSDKREVTLANLRIGDKFRVGAGGKHGYHLLSRASEGETDMTDKPNAIEEIMAQAACDEIAEQLGVRISGVESSEGWAQHVQVIRAILAALDAAGLKVVPVEADFDMVDEACFGCDTFDVYTTALFRDEHDNVNAQEAHDDFRIRFREAVKAFNPATWKPKEGR